MKPILYKDLSYSIIGAAMEVHTVLGNGFLETVYENALVHELKIRGMSYSQQLPLPVVYKGKVVGNYIADIVVEKKLILELKVVQKLTEVHRAQAINYLAATDKQLAILLNFGLSSFEYRRVVSKRNINSRNS